MFGNKTKDIVKIDTLIGSNAVINGNVTGSGNYKVDGIIVGNINVTGDVIIDKKAVVTGDITCKSLICGGKVNGGVNAKSVTYRATAVVVGDTNAKNMVIEDGADITGSCTMKSAESGTKTVADTYFDDNFNAANSAGTDEEEKYEL